MEYYIDLSSGRGNPYGDVKVTFAYTSKTGDIVKGRKYVGFDAGAALELFSCDIIDQSILPPVDLSKPCTITLSKDGPS
ncbi:MAG: hypothetical protein HDT15_04410 [Oscillibacter sp.]|nr:hypothetical protein [Oscillibacter sp.]